MSVWLRLNIHHCVAAKGNRNMAKEHNKNQGLTRTKKEEGGGGGGGRKGEEKKERKDGRKRCCSCSSLISLSFLSLCLVIYTSILLSPLSRFIPLPPCLPPSISLSIFKKTQDNTTITQFSLSSLSFLSSSLSSCLSSSLSSSFLCYI